MAKMKDNKIVSNYINIDKYFKQKFFIKQTQQNSQLAHRSNNTQNTKKKLKGK